MQELGRPQKNRSNIVDILKGRFLLSSELITELQQMAGMSRPAASRAVERAQKAEQIFSSKPVSFGPGRDHLNWLPQATATLQYFAEIGPKLQLRPPFECAVQALLASSGALPKDYLSRFIPAPIAVRYGKPTVEKILWDLKHLKVIEEQPAGAYGFLIALTDGFQQANPPDKPPISLQLTLRTEGLLLKVIAQWLQVTSMAAWNSVQVRNSHTGVPVTLNGFAFDLKAPTYLQPLARRGKRPVPGFLVADVNMSEFREFEAKAFVRKLSFIRERKNPPAVLGICFAERFQKKAFKLLKERGVMVVPLSRLGSQSLPELIRCIAQIFENVQLETNPDFSKALSAVERLTTERESNLSGSTFELMISHFLTKQGHTVRFLDKKISGVLQSGKSVEREVDVVSEKGDVLFVAEAKGYHRFQPVELAEVTRFFDETAHVAGKVLKTNQVHSTVAHCFYTSSYFKRDAREYLEALKTKHAKSKKLRIEFMDGNELKQKWETESMTDLCRYLERYFGTQRKRVYDPETQVVIDTPVPQFEQIASSPPEPTEAESLDEKSQSGPDDFIPRREDVTEGPAATESAPL